MSAALIILTLALSAESIFAGEVTQPCTATHAVSSISDGEALVSNDADASPASFNSDFHPCHIGHCSVVLVSEAMSASPLYSVQVEQAVAYNFSLSMHPTGLLRPPSARFA